MKRRGKKKIIAALLMVLAMCFFTACQKEAAADNTVAGPEESKALTREELLFGDVWLCGEKITFPCKVKELPQGFTITQGVVVTGSDGNMALIDLLYNGEKVGDITIDGVDKSFGGYYDFSAGYEEYNVHSIESHNIVIRGITSTSSKEELINAFGEPDKVSDSGDYITYYSYADNRSKVNFIYRSFLGKEKLDITVYYYLEDEKDEQ